MVVDDVAMSESSWLQAVGIRLQQLQRSKAVLVTVAARLDEVMFDLFLIDPLKREERLALRELVEDLNESRDELQAAINSLEEEIAALTALPPSPLFGAFA
jgi:hypothetical protein